MSPRVLVISSQPAGAGRLRADLARCDCEVAYLHPDELEPRSVAIRPPRVVVVDLRDPRAAATDARQLLRSNSRLCDVPTLAMVSHEQLGGRDRWDEVDDFIAAPYRWEELRARLSRLLARADGAHSATAIKIGELTLDPDRYDVTVAGARVDLTLKEYELLKHLATHVGRVFTRAQLLDSIWGDDYVGGTRTVDVHIRRLRAKLGEVGETSIDTVRGVGYAWRPPGETT